MAGRRAPPECLGERADEFRARCTSAGAEGGGKERTPGFGGRCPPISFCYQVMDLSTMALSAAPEVLAVQVARLPAAATDKTAAWMPHTLAAALKGARKDMGI